MGPSSSAMKRRSGAISPLRACALQRFVQTFFMFYLAVLCSLGKHARLLPWDVLHSYVSGLGSYVQHWPVLMGRGD